MFIDNIKKQSYKRTIMKLIIVIAVFIALIYYVKLFFTSGVYFDDTFLKREDNSSETIYSGSSDFGDIRITVQGIKNQDSCAKVIYQLPNGINKEYVVEFKTASFWEAGIQAIKDSHGNVVFEGDYNQEGHFLTKKDGGLLLEHYPQVIIVGQDPYDVNYKISLSTVADFVYSSKSSIRGTYHYLVFALVLFALAFIDYKFPLLFFNLRHRYEVKDPEPSDSYLFWQRVAWFLYPLIGIVFMIVAL